MKFVQIERPTQEELDKLGVFSWPIWKKEVSRFQWEYDQKEICYFLEGEVCLENAQGEKAKFGKGDLVIFSKGLCCVWNVLSPVRKHYRFGD